ncbi:hypothetical protein TELCIR_24323, partial [Teladorsagia circumcincta]
EFQDDVFKRSGEDSRTSGLPESEDTQGQRECLLLSSTETLFGLQYQIPYRASATDCGEWQLCGEGAWQLLWQRSWSLHHTEGDMDFKIHFNIMETVISSRTAQSGFILQQDNYPKHKSKLFTKWFHDNVVPLLLWLSRSPDCNPIKDLWDELESQVRDPLAQREQEEFPQLTTA